MKEKQIILNDKRKLCYAEYGIADGYPILYCHGSQSSRLEMHYDDSFAVKNNLRIITFDRPGHGRSDYDSKASIQSVAYDVKQLMEQLGIREYSVLGMSAGAPFAMSIAFLNKQEVNKLGIVSGFAPFTTKNKLALKKEIGMMLQLAKWYPFILRILLKLQRWKLKKNPAKALNNFLRVMSAPDQKVLKNIAVLSLIERMFIEAFRNSHKGVAHEISKILVRDWNLNLSKLDVPTYIYQGSEDSNVPLAWAKYLQNKIPTSELKIFENEGHLIIFNHAKEIFTALIK